MGRKKPVCVVVLTSCSEWSGMIISEIIKEDIKITGIILDTEKHDKAGQDIRIPFQKRLFYRVMLSTTFQHLYLKEIHNRISKLLGFRNITFYEKLNHKESKIIKYITKYTGKNYKYILDINRKFLMLNEVARLYDIPLYEVPNINNHDSYRLLKKLQPELMVGLGTRIIQPHILAIPSIGTLNGHSSILPNYRGGAAEFWQLVHNEKETGVTIHFMQEQVDKGNIVKQKTWPIYNGSNHYNLRIVSQFGRIDLWREAVRAVINGEKGIKQGKSNFPTFHRPNLEQLFKYYKKQK